VAFTNETHLIGVAAMNQYLENPHRTIFDIVSLMDEKGIYCEALRMLTVSPEAYYWPEIRRPVPPAGYQTLPLQDL
jgi:hypothetical protein